jgi:predicted RNA-binding protein with PIN domain
MLVVDGNNVPCPFRPWHRTAWNAPLRLVMDLARLTRAWSACVDIFFDGPPRPGLPNGTIVDGIRIHYAWPRIVDDRLVDVVAELRRDGDPTVVVTSDRALGRRVRAFGAKVVSSECLRRALDRVAGAAHLGVSFRSPLLESPDALVGLERALEHRARGP